MTDDKIREIFMAHGFTVKEGQTDLKPYVYAAARALLAAGASERKRHPNDNAPHDPACEAALDKLDAQAGQGVDAFYAMAFRDGWQAHGAASASEGQTAKQRYDASGCAVEESDPIARLRFFCSLAMNGQDWLDVEPFFDAITKGASEGQEPVAEIIKCHNMRGDTWFDLKMFRRDLPNGAKLYADPSAEIAALRERIAGMEKDARDARLEALSDAIGEFSFGRTMPEVKMAIHALYQKEKQK